MKDAVFRSAGFWKSAIMTLPDNSFFELLRSVFGKIKTPFNKQILVDDLENFLLRKDIQKTIAAYIDDRDSRVIAAVALLNEPVSGELESFFSGELSYVELHDIVVNLEERFIFYRFSEKGHSRLALNPVLEPVLAPLAADVSLLFPSASAEDSSPERRPERRPELQAEPDRPLRPAGDSPLGGRMLAALLSFVSTDEPFFKTEGEIRKRIIDAADRVFPGLDLWPLIGGLRALGLFRAEGDRLVPDYRRFSDFGKLKLRERLEYCAAGIYCFDDSGSPREISPYLFHARIRSFAVFIHRFLDSLEPERLYPVKTLKRLADILGRDGLDDYGDCEKINGSVLVKTLEKSGLLVPAAAEYRRVQYPADAEAADAEATDADAADADAADTGAADAAKAPRIAMDTPFSCVVYPEISYADAISLASALSVREAGVTVRFELTRDSAVRSFDRGFCADSIIDLLKRLSADRINETLIWTLKDWEKRYGEVSFRRGLILNLSPERRYLAETAPLARIIRETLAPGIYLLPETMETEAVEALQKAGVDIIARRGESALDSAAGYAGTRGPFPSLRFTGPSPNFRVPVSAKEQKSKDSRAASTLISGFHSILEQMQPGKTERDELAARINRRLVLCEAQLREASVRYEKLEAGGLDYAGKAIIAKQAIALQSPVELVRAGKTGERIFGIPRALEKDGGENILIISSLDESGDSIRIPLGKISLLRRIKKSIFENNP